MASGLSGTCGKHAYTGTEDCLTRHHGRLVFHADRNERDHSWDACSVADVAMRGVFISAHMIRLFLGRYLYQKESGSSDQGLTRQEQDGEALAGSWILRERQMAQALEI